MKNLNRISVILVSVMMLVSCGGEYDQSDFFADNWRKTHRADGEQTFDYKDPDVRFVKRVCREYFEDLAKELEIKVKKPLKGTDIQSFQRLGRKLSLKLHPDRKPEEDICERAPYAGELLEFEPGSACKQAYYKISGCLDYIRPHQPNRES